MSNDEEFMNAVYNKATPLNIVGIVIPKNESLNMTGVLYTRDLTEYVINSASESEIVKKTAKNKDVNVFNGRNFNEKIIVQI